MIARKRCISRGFTLLELLVVIAIIAVATAGVTLSLRDTDADALEREATRLAAMLEAGRAESRATGVPITWQARPNGFAFEGAAQRGDEPASLQGEKTWLNANIRAVVQHPEGKDILTLGPEPILPAQAVLLLLGENRLTVMSNGLTPFKVQAEAPAS